MIAVEKSFADAGGMPNPAATGVPARSFEPCRIVVAGGGTGGHLFPGIAVAREFLNRHPETRILFVSSGNEFERDALAREGFELKRVRAAAIKGKGRWQQLRALVAVPLGACAGMSILMHFKPEIVIGLGSYSAAPVVLAACLMRIPVVLHEQNIMPGITNRMLARWVDRVCVSFEKTVDMLPHARLDITGNPVRSEFFKTLRPSGAKTVGQNDGKFEFTVLIIGGSQGAHGINTAVIDALDHLPRGETYRFVHQTGRSDLAAVRAAYAAHGLNAEVDSFFIDMADRYQRADLVICRAGATTVAELTALGKPALFIPFPYAADNHQALNAQSLVDAGAAKMILQKDLTGKKLAMHLDEFRRHPGRLAEMAAEAAVAGRPGAAGAIVDICYEIMGKKTGFKFGG